MKKLIISSAMLFFVTISSYAQMKMSSKYSNLAGEYELQFSDSTGYQSFKTNLFILNNETIKFKSTITNQLLTLQIADLKSAKVTLKKGKSQAPMWIGSILGALGGFLIASALQFEETKQEGMYEVTTTYIPLWPIYGFSFLGGIIGNGISDEQSEVKQIFIEKVGFVE
jgi:hypothetical protein